MRLIRLKRRGPRLLPPRGLQPSGPRVMTEELKKVGIGSPESDCNSNHTNKTDHAGETTGSYVSNASSQDVDFIQDNSDYQWFLDYGYRDGSTQQHTSILSMSQSYGEPHDISYDDMAKNLDANLAEIDMENFRTEDIHSILTLPAMCCGDIQTNRQGEMFASVSGSMMAKFDFDSSISPRSSSQGEESGSTDMSICKSEPLFSPVKECPLPTTNFSVDSLDCDLLTEHDIMLTCQANKNNYTIAFEGSMTLCSEDSDYHETGDSEATDSNNWSERINAGLDNSLVRSDSVYTTWSKLRRSRELRRPNLGSNNNNSCSSNDTSYTSKSNSALKSQSLPNLFKKCFLTSINRMSQMSSSVESDHCVKLFDIQNSSSAHSSSESGSCTAKQNFSLVKLFMKQKSISNDGISVGGSYMDQSQEDNFAPSSLQPSDANESSDWPSNSQSESDSFGQDSTRREVRVNKSGKLCGGVDNVKNEFVLQAARNNNTCLNNCECQQKDDTAQRHKGLVCDNETATGRVNPSHTCLTNGTLMNNRNSKSDDVNNWIKTDTTEYSTCFEDSLVEHGYLNKKCGVIEERIEEADPSESSVEGAEQLSVSMYGEKEDSTLDVDSSLQLDSEECASSQNNTRVLNTHSSRDKKPKSMDVINNVFCNGKSKFNINNNIEERSQTHAQQRNIATCQGTQTKKLNGVGNSPPDGNSSNSSSEAFRNTYVHQDKKSMAGKLKIHRGSPSKVKNNQTNCHSGNPKGKPNIAIATTKHTSTQIPVHVMDQSIQTSSFADVTTKCPYKLLENPNKTSLVKTIEPTANPATSPTKSGSKQQKENKESPEGKKPVYVFYPNYSLPDLTFLKEKQDFDAAVFLMPQKYSLPPSPQTRSRQRQRRTRPLSCNDLESLKKKNFSHIQDWDSLNFLLPQEYKQILADVPEIFQLQSKESAIKIPTSQQIFCVPKSNLRRPVSCDYSSLTTDGKNSSSSSIATQPSSGYRGSSTLLSDSSHASYSPLFVYRYDSMSSESSMSHDDRPPPLPKRSISLPSGEKTIPEDCEHPPPRPPLPKGILRKSSLKDDHCKLHMRKRYSMSEFSGAASKEELIHKRRSLQEPYEYLSRKLNYSQETQSSGISHGSSCIVEQEEQSKKTSEKDECEDEGVDAGTDTSYEHPKYKMRPPTPPIPKSSENHEPIRTSPGSQDTTSSKEAANIINNNILQIEDDLFPKELLQMSGLGEVKWDEKEMLRLRSQVSQFLCMKGNLEKVNEALQQPPDADKDEKYSTSNPQTPNNTPETQCSSYVSCDCACTCGEGKVKKSVSFAEKVCIHLRETPDRLTTPPNSPNISLLSSHRQYQCKLHPDLVEMAIDEESEARDPDEMLSVQRGTNQPKTPPSEGTNEPQVVPVQCSHPVSVAQRVVTMDLTQKRALVMAVTVAVEKLITYFSQATTQTECELLGDSSKNPLCAQITLQMLCPAMYAVLSDGLQPAIESVFGSIHNSVWRVVEASAQQGPVTKALNDLVLRVNDEEVLTEAPMKFNAFIFGLLNIHSFDAWLSYLRTRESILHKHYHPDGFLFLANSAARNLVDQLLMALQPLTLLPFRLDLLFEYKVMHQNLQRMDQRYMEHSERESIRSGSPSQQPLSPTRLKQWTMKLVKSLHSSFSQSYEDQSSFRRRESSPKGDKDDQQSLRRAFSDEATHYSNYLDPMPFVLPTIEGLPDVNSDRPRPRSCVDANASGFSLTDIASTMKKRWSGIQLGSKLFQAFDKLLVEDIASGEEEYTDSLENPKIPSRKHTHSSSSNNSTSDDNNDLTKDDSPLPDRKLPQNSEKGKEASKDVESNAEEAERQQQMPNAKTATSMGCSRDETTTQGGKFKRLQMKWELLSGKDTRTNSNNNARSKIPRPVTSPVRASAIPVPVHSNQTSSTAAPANVNSLKKVFNPKNETARRSIKSRSSSGGSREKDGNAASEEVSNSVIARPQMAPKSAIYGTVGRRPTRLSRVDHDDSIDSTANRSIMGRSSSLGHRSVLTQNKARSGSTKSDRRVPLNKQKQAHQEESQSKQRYVQTLCHRLPADSGHLTFNEGEILMVVLEVDSKWLLCCRGDQKGLVPKSAVITLDESYRF